MGGNKNYILEHQVMLSNRSYKVKNMAFIKKIADEYLGVYRGIPVAFGCEETDGIDGFSLKNICNRKVKFIHDWVLSGGQAFLLVHFKKLNRVYRLDYITLMWYWEKYIIKGCRELHNIPLNEFEQNCKLIKSGNGITLNYLEGIS